MELDDIDTTDVNLDDDFLDDWDYLRIEKDQTPLPIFLYLYLKYYIAMMVFLLFGFLAEYVGNLRGKVDFVPLSLFILYIS